MTRFERAVDAAIAQYNRDFLADPDAIREAQEMGDRWRKQLEREGILPRWRKTAKAKDLTNA